MESVPRSCCLAAFLLFCGPAIACVWQQPDPKPGAGTEAAGDLGSLLRECLADSPDTKTLRIRLEAYRKALGAHAEVAVVVCLLDGLRNCPPDAKPTLEGARITELLDRVSFHRRRGHPERMLPALAVLEKLLPNDARVLYSLGEAYGVQSPVFDAHKAEAAFARLYEQLVTEPNRPKTPLAQTAELVKFLPELGGPLDRTAWFRDRVRGFCETLRDGQPIGLWKLRDPRLEELQEDLRVALPHGVQKELVDILTQVRAIHPDDPASCYMLAQVHASLGPAFLPDRSVELFRQFLDLTAEERFQKASEEDPLATRDEVAKRLRGLQVANAKDDLQALRMDAKEILAQFAAAKGKPQPYVFFPELSVLQTTLKELQKQWEKDGPELEKTTNRIAVLKQELESARADYERWKRESAVRRRGVADPQPFLDAISSRKQAIERLEKKQEQMTGRTGDLQQRIAALEARLKQFDK